MIAYRPLTLAVTLATLVGCAQQPPTPAATPTIEPVPDLVAALETTPYQVTDNGRTPLVRGLQSPPGSDARALAERLLAESSTTAIALLRQISQRQLKAGELDQYLAQQRFYIDVPIDEQGHTLLSSLAAGYGFQDHLQVLLAHGASPQTRFGDDKLTPLMQAIRFGSLANARLLIAGGAGVNDASAKGLTPLHLTASPESSGQRTSDLALIQLLVQAGAKLDANAPSGITPLQLAVLNDRPRVVDALLAAGANPDIRDDQGRTPLHNAIRLDRPHLRDQLLAAGANPDIATDRLWTPLMTAVDRGDLATTQALLAAGSTPDLQTDDGATALHLTADTSCLSGLENDPELARRLIAAGASLDIRNQKGTTPLYWSIANDRPHVREQLLAAGANPDIGTHDNWTPLHQAVFWGREAAAIALIEAGANLETTFKNGWTPLHYTTNNLEHGNRKYDRLLAQQLIQAGANLNPRNSDGFTPLALAIINERANMRDVLLAAGADPGVCDNNGWAPLGLAAYYGQVTSVEKLLAVGADANQRDDLGRSVLQQAVTNKEPDDRSAPARITRLLIEAGADPNLPADNGLSPLFMAVMNDFPEVRDQLLEADANPNATMIDVGSLLGRATSHGKRESVQKLLAAGVNLAPDESSSRTALHIAAFTHHADLIQPLIDAGLDIDAQDHEGKTPLFLATHHAGATRTLLAASADPNIPTRAGWTPLLYAVLNGRHEPAAILLDHDADPNAKVTATGDTSLHLIARVALEWYREHQKDPDLIRNLVAAGADPDSRNVDGNTALILAVRNTRPKLVAALLEQGANTGITNNAGSTAADEAVRVGAEDCLALLREQQPVAQR